MPGYVAMLRGIGPGNPQMRNDKLRGSVETLGFAGVRTVMSSGNVLFESSGTDRARLEAHIETAVEQQLGFTSTAMVRDRGQLDGLIDAHPFGDLEHSRTSYLLVTFLKYPSPIALPEMPVSDAHRIALVSDDAVCTVTDTTLAKTSDVMAMLERHFDKQLTSRTWNTVHKIHQRMR